MKLSSGGSIKSEREKYEPKSRDEVEKEMGGIGFDQAREEKKKAEEADQESVLFSCVRCGLNEMCHYLGRYVVRYVPSELPDSNTRLPIKMTCTILKLFLGNPPLIRRN